jgi:hypothetical protein
MTLSTFLIGCWLLLLAVNPGLALWPVLAAWAVFDVFVLDTARSLFGLRGPDDRQGPPST